jgi:hypothetical protein
VERSLTPPLVGLVYYDGQGFCNRRLECQEAAVVFTVGRSQLTASFERFLDRPKPTRGFSMDASHYGVYLRGNGGVPARKPISVLVSLDVHKAFIYGVFEALAPGVPTRKKGCTCAERGCTYAEETVYLRGKRSVPARKKGCTCAEETVYLRGKVRKKTPAFPGVFRWKKGRSCNVVFVLSLFLLNNRESKGIRGAWVMSRLRRMGRSIG